MAIIAYASSQPNPLVSQVDKVIDLALEPLGGNVQLYGAGQEDGSPTLPAGFTYLWTIVSKPTGSLVQFQDSSSNTSTLQNPILKNVDVWGNYLVFLQATNPATGHSSTSSYLTSDAVKARTVVRLKSQYASIQKPAAYEWSWHGVVGVWADVIENLKSATLVLPASVLQLIGGGYAFLGTLLHKHYGTDVDKATTTTRGTIGVSDTPIDANNPVALNRDVIPLTCQVTGFRDGGGIHLWRVGINQDSTGLLAHFPLCLFEIPDDCFLEEFHIHMQDGGEHGDYAFGIYAGAASDWAAGTQALVTGFTITGGTVTPNEQLFLSKSATAVSVSKGRWLGVVCTGVPTTLGGGMTVNIPLRRKV